MVFSLTSNNKYDESQYGPPILDLTGIEIDLSTQR